MTPEESREKRDAGVGSAPSHEPVTRRATRGRKWLSVLVVVYALLIVGVWALMVWGGDRYWLATLVLFGPRWLCALPLPLLAVAAVLWHRRLLVLLAVVALIIVGPLMGFQVHWPARADGGPVFRVLTCNVNQNDFDTRALAALIAKEQPDVVAIQEVSSATRYIWPAGWHVLNHDEFTLASRWPIAERDIAHVDFPRNPAEVAAIRYSVQWSEREVQFFNLHLESPRAGLEAVLRSRHDRKLQGTAELTTVSERRAREAERISRWIAQFDGAKISAGDFNMPTDSTIYRRYWSSFDNAFSSTGWGLGFTKNSAKRGWSYGARIDHVLFTPPWRCLGCWVGDDVGSDHLPLVAEFQWQP